MNKINKTKKGNISILQIAIIVLSIYLVFTFVKQQIDIKELSKQNQVADKELKTLKSDIKDLETKIDKSDTIEYIEKISREELDMLKPHELIYKDKNKAKKQRNVKPD